MKFKHSKYPSPLLKVGDKGIQFSNYIAETEDKDIIKALKQNPHVEALEEEKTIDKMTVPELLEYAESNKINLGEATKKDDILAVINDQPQKDDK